MSKYNMPWSMKDTELRLDKLQGGCETIEEARRKFIDISNMRLHQCWKKMRMGYAIRHSHPDYFQTVHVRWAQEHKLNGNVISKDI